MKNSRRRFLALAGLGGVTAVGSLAYTRGLRYPPLQFEPDPVAARGEAGPLAVRTAGAMLQRLSLQGARARAFVPEPALWLRCPDGFGWRLALSNVHPAAVLEAEPGRTEERIENLERVVQGRGETRLRWRFPRRDRLRFTAIGDSGGGEELRWVLHRSAELGADFVLHLGDLNYERGDFARAAAAFAAAAMPCYAAIGNHDFHAQGRSVHREFTGMIGPRNSAFRLGGVQFVNLDTAADSFPPGLGKRGKIIGNLPDPRQSGEISDCVVYTHRPLVDPRTAEDPSHSHGVNGLGEADWLRRQLLARGVTTLLAGHLRPGPGACRPAGGTADRAHPGGRDRPGRPGRLPLGVPQHALRGALQQQHLAHGAERARQAGQAATSARRLHLSGGCRRGPATKEFAGLR